MVKIHDGARSTLTNSEWASELEPDPNPFAGLQKADEGPWHLPTVHRIVTGKHRLSVD